MDIDAELLEEATVLLGASTMKEAVNRSLEKVVSRRVAAGTPTG